jgi:hypothetical protein
MLSCVIWVLAGKYRFFAEVTKLSLHQKKELKFTGISKKLKITTHQHQGEIRHFEAIIKVIVTSQWKFPKFGDPAKKNAINRTTSHHTKVETARSGRASQVLSF